MTSRRAPRMTALAAKYTPPEWLRGSAYSGGSFCNAVPLGEGSRECTELFADASTLYSLATMRGGHPVAVVPGTIPQIRGGHGKRQGIGTCP